MVLAQNLEDNDVFVQTAGIKALTLSLQDRTTEAVILYRGVSELLGEDGPIADRASVQINLGDILLQSDLPGAEEHFRAAIDLTRRIGDHATHVVGTSNLALLHLLRGEWDDAEQVLSEAAALGGSDLTDPILLTHVATLAALRGDVPRASDLLDAMTDLGTSDDVQDRTLHGAVRALVALVQGHVEEAAGLGATAAHECIRDFGVRTESFRLAWPIAVEAALRAGLLDQVDELLDMVTGRPVGHVPPYLRAQLARFRGLLAAARGQHDGVEADLERAADILDDLGYPYHHAVTLLDRAEWLIARSRGAEAPPLLEQAEDVFTHVGASPQLDRITQARAAHVA
jgi:tetratricopeptide (TPR) repeat protein